MAMASSGMGYGNGVFPATEGAVSHAPDSPVSSWYEGSETFYVPEKREVHKGQAHAYANPGHMNNTAGSIVESAVYSAGVRLSDTHLASRKAVEAATRRQQAILWLQDAVGDLGLSSRSTEEDLRLSLRNGIALCKLINKVQPGAVLKVVANTALSNHLDGAQSALQYFENVRNFLVAVEEMGLPSFEVSDLEQGSMSSNSSAKLVDCILALKSYNDWKQGGALGFWRLKSPSHPTVNKNIPVPKLSRSKSTNNSSNARKKWAIPDPESLDDTSVTSSSNEAPTFEPDSSVSGHETSANGQSEETSSSVGDGEEAAYSEISSAVSKSNWLQHLGEKFHEVLQVNAKSLHGITDTIPITFDGYDGKSISALDNAPSQSLLSLISAILCDKTVEEVPVVVEFMLRKVMEEFERHLVAQRKQVAKMKSSIQEIMAREAKLTSQNSVIVTLVAGTQEEIKLHAEMLHKTEAEMMALKEEKRAKEEEIGRLLQENEEKHSAVQMLKNELDRIKRTDKELLERLESQKREFELECQANIKSLELQLQDSHEKLEELKLNSAREMSSLRMKDTQYQTFLSNQLVEYKNLRLSQLNTKDEFSRMQMEWSNQFSVLEEQLHNMARAASGYHKVLAENRVLYNEVQDLKRVRPFLKEEIGNLSTLDYVGENGELMLVNPLKPGAKDSRKSFVFNKCFAPNSSQEEVYLDTQPLIRSVLDGFNVCIFAYGQTGSGKTFTMSGPNNMTPTDWGVNYRALHDLFHTTQSRQDVFQYEIGVQMLEIYNEQVRDLLSVDGVQKKLEIRNNSGLNGLNVPDATMMSVGSTEDVLDLMKLGQRNRAVGATALNERSSRSHSVLTVHVQGTDLESGAILRGSLHLVDLAGSERVDRSEATGDRLKEAQHINKSLSALGDVIAALAQKNGHVPYRNSKLTQLLQDSLGGQAKTLMFVHISPDVESFGETVSTLKFAERVSTVELGAARSNKESGEIQNLKEQISLLKEAAAKKDAEISNLQTFKERFERGECGVGVEKFKSRPSKPTSRVRASIDTTAVQKVRVVQNEAASGAVEHRPKTRKLPGESKAPLRVGVTSSHDPEDLSEQVVSSSACSPASSPTGQWGIFNIIEDGVKLKYLKNQENGSDSGVTKRTFQNHNTTKTDSGQFLVKERSKSMPEAVLAHHVEASLSGIRDEVKELPERSQHGAEESGTFSQEVEKQRFNANGGSLYEAGNGDSEAIRSVCSSQRSLQGLEDQLESDGIFDLRDGYDDSSSLFSESGLSVEADQSSTTTQLEQSKKSQSSLTQARRSVSLQSQVPRPPISKKSSLVMDRKSVGAPLQPRHRRLPSAGVTSSTDKLSHMRTPSLGAVANTEFESSGNRRVAIGAGSSTSWR